MKTQELLDLDMTEQKNKDLICRMLYKIKYIQKQTDNPSNITFDILEKTLQGLCSHCSCNVQTIYPYFEDNKFMFYCASVVKKESTTTWSGNVYGKSMFEVFAKLCIKIYSEARKGH